MTAADWPAAPIDPIMRLRALAAALPGSCVTERIIAAPIEMVWAVASDLEVELPHFVTDVRSVQVTPGEAQRSVALIRGRSGLRGSFDVVLRPGWCLMQSRFVIGAMAAAPSVNGTKFVLLGALRIPGARYLSPVLRIIGRRLGARMARRFQLRIDERMASS